MKKYLSKMCCLYIFGVCQVLAGCGQDNTAPQNYTAAPDKFVQGNIAISNAEDAEETESTEYPIETVYTDEDYEIQIEYGGISFHMIDFHLTKTVEEEDKTTFCAELDADRRELEWWADKPMERTYVISREEDLVINDYREAMQYFERISEYQAFRSYSENEKIS